MRLTPAAVTGQHVDDAHDEVVKDGLDREIRDQGPGKLAQDVGEMLLAIHERFLRARLFPQAGAEAL